MKWILLVLVTFGLAACTGPTSRTAEPTTPAPLLSGEAEAPSPTSETAPASEETPAKVSDDDLLRNALEEYRRASIDLVVLMKCQERPPSWSKILTPEQDAALRQLEKELATALKTNPKLVEVGEGLPPMEVPVPPSKEQYQRAMTEYQAKRAKLLTPELGEKLKLAKDAYRKKTEPELLVRFKRRMQLEEAQRNAIEQWTGSPERLNQLTADAEDESRDYSPACPPGR